uniref:Uncharacterized protein n=1 Tax=Ciona intestinalis TaxID=7719 RepID=H2XJU9_CIOIN
MHLLHHKKESGHLQLHLPNGQDKDKQTQTSQRRGKLDKSKREFIDIIKHRKL